MEHAPEDVSELLRSIPACIRCRGRHRKCDAALPRCHNCTKADISECLYYDHILDKDVSRSHLVSLVTRLQQLRENAHSSLAISSCAQHLPNPILNRRLFVGPGSCVPASLSISKSGNEDERASQQGILSSLMHHSKQPTDVSGELHNFLMNTYLDTVHKLYPIIAEATIEVLQHRDTSHEPLLHKSFLESMIYSVSCYCIPQHHPQVQLLLPLAAAFHRNAMGDVDDVTSSVDIQSLRNITLMAIHSLFAPSESNSSQLIALAARMCVDLNLRTSNDHYHRRLFLSILCIERQICLTLDKPWFLQGPPKQPRSEHNEPIELLWLLLSLHCSLRRMPGTVRYVEDAPDLADFLDIKRMVEILVPPVANLECALQEVELVIGELGGNGSLGQTSRNALALLQTYSKSTYFHTFMTPHWIFKAARMILAQSKKSGTNAPEGMRLALVMLDRDSLKWPSCTYLHDFLQKELNSTADSLG